MKKQPNNEKTPQEEFATIYEMFTHSAPPLPESLHEKNIQNMLETKQTHKRIRIPHVYWRAICSTAACLVLLCSALFGVFTQIPLLTDSRDIDTFTNTQALAETVRTLQMPSYPTELGSGGAAVSHAAIAKNTPQVTQTNGRYICYVYNYMSDSVANNKIYTFSAQGKTVELASILNQVGSKSSEIEGIFLYKDKLSVLLSEDNNSSVQLQVYDMTDPASPQLTGTFTQSGRYVNAYLLNGVVYLVSLKSASRNSEDAGVPYSGSNEKTTPVPIQNIACFDHAQTAQYLVLSAADAETGTQCGETRAVLGASDSIFCQDDTLYIPSSAVFPYNKSKKQPATQIITAKLRRKGICFTAETTLDTAMQIICMDMYKGRLRILCQEKAQDTTACRLYILNQKMQTIGKSDTFAKGQEVNGFAFLQNTVYISSSYAELTIYTFDLSDESAPKLRSSQSAQGRSVTYVELSKTRLLAICAEENTNGTILELYATDSETEPRLLNRQEYGDLHINTDNILYEPKNDYYAFACYTADARQRHYGSVTLQLQNDQIKVTNRFFNHNDADSMYQGNTIAIDNYLYNFEINDNLPDPEKVCVFAFQYKE